MRPVFMVTLQGVAISLILTPCFKCISRDEPPVFPLVTLAPVCSSPLKVKVRSTAVLWATPTTYSCHTDWAPSTRSLLILLIQTVSIIHTCSRCWPCPSACCGRCGRWPALSTAPVVRVPPPCCAPPTTSPRSSSRPPAASSHPARLASAAPPAGRTVR